MELAGAQASKIAKRKFGYKRSPELTQRGAQLLLYMHILDCKYQCSPLTPSIQRWAATLGVDPETTLSQPSTQIRKEVTRLRQELWTTQKTCREARMEWLNKIAQDQALAENIPNWETKIKQMLKESQERSINKKFTTATKRAYRPFNIIQIPTHK
jgi:hypothetical protein